MEKTLSPPTIKADRLSFPPAGVGTNSIRSRLVRLGIAAPESELQTWTLFLELACERLKALQVALDAAEPRFVRDEVKPTQGVVLNHLTLEETAMVASLIELIDAWALVPYLSITNPISSRSKEFLQLVEQVPKNVVIEHAKKLELPLMALKVFYSCLSCHEIFQLVIDSVLVDIIPGLVKFGYEKTNLAGEAVKWSNEALKHLVTNPVVPSVSMARLLFLHLSLLVPGSKEEPTRLSVHKRVLSGAICMLLCERTDGVYGVLSALLDTSTGIVDSDLIIKAAHSIAHPPASLKMHDYFARICPQLLTILRSPRSPNMDKFLSCACETFRIWSTAYPELTLQHLLIPALSPFFPLILLYQYRHRRQSSAKDPLTYHLNPDLKSIAKPTQIRKSAPLIQIIDPNESKEPLSQTTSETETHYWYSIDFPSWNSQPGVIVNHTTISITVDTLSLLVLACGDSAFFKHFISIVPTVAIIFTLSKGNKKLVSLEKNTTLILQRIFKLIAMNDAVDLLLYLGVHHSYPWRQLYKDLGCNNAALLSYQIEKMESENLGLVASNLPVDPNDDTTIDSRSNSMMLIDVLSVLDDDEISGVVFLKLLEDLFATMTVLNTLTQNQQDGDVELMILASEKQIRLMHTIMPLIDRIGPSVLRNAVQICMFVKQMLENDDEEILILSLTILQQVLLEHLVSKAEADILLVDLLSPLKVLQTHSNEHISPLAQQCYDEILHYNSTTKGEGDRNDSGIPSEQKRDSSDAYGEEEGTLKAKKKKRQWVQEPHADSVDEALRMISNPLIPIRAGGLIQLRRFLLREDPEVMSRLPNILDTFIKHLSNEDSYVYLGAIQGLSAVADVKFSLAMPALMEQYRSTSRGLEIRLKVGESILQVARRLGQLLPFHAETFFALLLSSAKSDPEALMRASSLSNIAELCELLKFALLPYIEEIIAMCYGILQVEKDELVRRGCVNLIKQLFKGASKDVFSIISDHIHRLVELLQRIEETDRDLVLREHARIALHYCHEDTNQAVQQALQDRSRHPLLEPDNFLGTLKFI